MNTLENIRWKVIDPLGNEIYLEKYASGESVNYVDDEILPNINEVRDERNEDLVGFVILDYRRNKPELVKRYPEYFF